MCVARCVARCAAIALAASTQIRKGKGETNVKAARWWKCMLQKQKGALKSLTAGNKREGDSGHTQGKRFIVRCAAHANVWVDYGEQRDWSDAICGQGEEFLVRATEPKNIWIPAGVSFGN